MLLDAEALAGRTVLVTGASGDIGRAIAATLGAAGATVIAHYGHRKAEAEDAVSAIPAERRAVVRGNLGNPSGARDLWRAACAIAPVDTVVLNAAVITPTPMDGTDEAWDAGWESVLAVNVVGTGTLMREAVKAFAMRKSGVVVTVSSWAAQQGSRILDVSGYAASKAAIRSLAQTFARQYARHGVPHSRGGAGGGRRRDGYRRFGRGQGASARGGAGHGAIGGGGRDRRGGRVLVRGCDAGVVGRHDRHERRLLCQVNDAPGRLGRRKPLRPRPTR